MPSIDTPLEQLRQYQPPLYREADFEDYWRATVAEATRQPLNAELIPYDLPARGIQCYAVRFDGFHGGRLAGWYLRPEAGGMAPGLCVYHGYSGRAPRPFDLLAYAQQGLCVLSMDCRGQNGQSQDVATYAEGHAVGWMTQGIREPKNFYYRYVYADAVRALELLARREEVDAKRLAITGISQGGGITLAVAALSERPILACPDIPFLCDYRRGVQIAPAGPYTEIPVFLKSFPELYEQAFRTLSYCDALNLAPWIKCRTLISNCLWDDVCPPSTIYGVYNHLTCEKQIEVYPYHKHEVPYEHHEIRFRAITEALLGQAGAAGRAGA
ncbi:MAG TPA: alpha/beta fold hydrolase [Tepidisphaeraceae bacterium]|nr:alpha/beta fold hydrolase [Tepidisphaeraceae bacterium]